MIKYALCIAVDSEHKNVVLIHKLKPAFQNGKLNTPGGKVDPEDYIPFENNMNIRHDELTSAVARYAAAREFTEETGLDSGAHEWKHVITLYSGDLNRYGDKDNWEMYISFTDKLDISKVRTMEAEKIEVFPINSLPDNIMPNLKWIIPLCLDGKFSEVIHIKER
jgi:8-oxo-dGTP diphosphatase